MELIGRGEGTAELVEDCGLTARLTAAGVTDPDPAQSGPACFAVPTDFTPSRLIVGIDGGYAAVILS